MKYLLIFLILFFSTAFAVEDYYVVPVGEAELETSKLYFDTSFSGSNFSKDSVESKIYEEVKDIFANDFSFYKKLFEVTTKKSESDYTTEFKLSKESQGAIFLESKTYETKSMKEIATTKAGISLSSARAQAHKVSDGIYQAITKKESMFTSKIIFVSDRTSRGKDIKKELYMMDFDGKGVKRLTSHNGTVISPAISYDGTKVLYSLIREGVRRRNVNLYIYDLKTDRTKLLSSRNGINSGAVFMPGDKEILLTLSHTGNSEIYRMNIETGQIKHVTKHYSIDVDPSINKDGTLMTFLSGRPGKPMIYTLDPRGVEKNVRRISFVGQFNATPRFSPDGKEIVFSSWLDNCFDLFRIGSDGMNLSRLTKNFGSNEDASYSKDGQFIVFTSKRVYSRSKAVQDLYIMDRNGEIIGKITDKFGNCISPRWSK